MKDIYIYVLLSVFNLGFFMLYIRVRGGTHGQILLRACTVYISIPEYTLGRLFTRWEQYSINKKGMFFGVFLQLMHILGAMVEQKNENGTKIFPFDR